MQMCGSVADFFPGQKVCSKSGKFSAVPSWTQFVCSKSHVAPQTTAVKESREGVVVGTIFVARVRMAGCLPRALRRHLRKSARYCEPMAVVEALVAIVSGVLLWIGFWDLIELVVPSKWYWKAGLIALGGVGLVARRVGPVLQRDERARAGGLLLGRRGHDAKHAVAGRRAKVADSLRLARFGRSFSTNRRAAERAARD